ncbi:hypothetical protein LTR37_004476 [Vermiconidia calcicola]|uniref:Uncharacterized protein n=1 Tax=Vermiconidia calcicola TaxID=1690605 RepID=A0ACC3NLR7_9PEZI|nr:hypothetical protein LTR37_004476 [Vermiconidia calcicola]
MAIIKQDWPNNIRRAAQLWNSDTYATKRKQEIAQSRHYWSHAHVCERRREERMWMIETYGEVLKLHESNFPTWIKTVERVLRECGLWTGVRYPCKPYVKLTEQRQDDDDRKDVWAVNIMLMYIDPYFLAREPIDKPVTGYDLLRQVEKGATPFRFLDLPRELRHHVYEYAAPDGEEHQEFVHGRRGISRPRAVRHLCSVSQEFREQFLRLYYSKYRFGVILLHHHGPEALQEWVELAGLRPLQYMRDLKVVMTYHKGYFDTVRVTFSPSTGLEARVQENCDWDYPDWTDKPQAHATSIEKRKRKQGWKGTGVFEFFTIGADGLREAIYGPWIMGDDEQEETNERDAYQVAYGKRQVDIYGGSPW